MKLEKLNSKKFDIFKDDTIDNPAIFKGGYLAVTSHSVGDSGSRFDCAETTSTVGSGRITDLGPAGPWHDSPYPGGALPPIWWQCAEFPLSSTRTKDSFNNAVAINSNLQQKTINSLGLISSEVQSLNNTPQTCTCNEIQSSNPVTKIRRF